MRANTLLRMTVLGLVLPGANLCLAQDAPPPTPKVVRLHRSFLDMQLAQFGSDTINRYRQAHPGQTEVDLKAVEFLGATALSLTGNATPDDLRRTSALGEVVIGGGSNDPIVAYAHALSLANMGDGRGAEASLRKAAAGLPGSPYPVAYQADTHMRLARLLAQTGRGEESRREYAAAADLIVETVKQADWTVDPRLTLDRVRGRVEQELSLELARSVVDRINELPGVDQWVAGTLRGVLEVRMAWKERGSGDASVMTKEGLIAFKAHMNAAYQQLSAAWKLAPERPEPAAALIAVAMGGGAPEGEDMQTWFGRTTDAELDFMPAYSAMLLGLSAQWHGGPAELVKFGMECAAAERYDTKVPLVLVEAMRQAGPDAWRRDENFRTQGPYPRVKGVLGEYVRQAQAPEGAAAYRTQLVAIASIGGEYALAREQLDAPGFSPDREVLSDWGLDAQSVTTDAYAFSGSTAPTALKGLAAAQKGDFATAHDLYKEALDGLRADERPVADALLERLEISRIAAAFQQEEQVALPFQPRLSGWSARSGKWSMVDQATVRTTAETGDAALDLRAPVGRRFELSGTIDVGGLGSRQDAGAGIAYGLDPTGPNPLWRSLLIVPSKNAATLQYKAERSALLAISPDGTQHEFTLKVWDEEAVVVVDGQQLFAGPAPDGLGRRDGVMLALVTQGAAAGDSAVFSDLRVTRLSQPPTELARPARNPFKLGGSGLSVKSSTPGKKAVAPEPPRPPKVPSKPKAKSKSYRRP